MLFRLGVPPPYPDLGPDLDGGYPIPGQDWYSHPYAGWGYHPILTWDGGIPHPDLGWGSPIHPDLGRIGSPSPPLADGGSPPPPHHWCELTHKLKLLPSPILRMRAVITFKLGSLKSGPHHQNQSCLSLTWVRHSL